MADDLKILVQVELEKKLSTQNINADIGKLQGQLKKIRLDAGISNESIKSISAQISKISNSIKPIDIKLNIDNGNNANVNAITKNVINNQKQQQQAYQQTANYLKGLQKTQETYTIGGEKLSEKRTVGRGLGKTTETSTRYSENGDKTTVKYIDNLKLIAQEAEKTEQKLLKIESVASSLTSKANIAHLNYSDPNTSKSITRQPNIDALNQQYKLVEDSILNVKNSNLSTFSQMKTEAESQIAKLKLMTTEFKNAENAATSLRSKSVATVKIDEGNNLQVFVEKMKQSGNYTTELQVKVANLEGVLSKVGDTQGLTSYLNQLDNVKSEFASINASAATLDKSTKISTNLDTELTKLSNFEKELQDLGLLSGDIGTKFNTLLDSFSKVETQSGLTTWRSELKGFGSDVAEATRQQNLFNSEIKALENVGKGMPTMSTNIADIETNLKKLNAPSEELKNKINQLGIEFKELDNIQDSDKKIEHYSKLKNEITNTRNEVNSLIKAQGQQVSELDKTKLSDTMTIWLNNNSKAAGEFGDKIRELQLALSTVDDKSGLMNVNKEFQVAKKSAEAMGLTGRTFGDEMKNNISKFAGWFGISQVIMTGVNALKTAAREMILAVKDIDAAMISLKKVTDETDLSYDKFLTSAGAKAQELGTSISDIITMTAEWSKAGYSLKDSENLASVSTIFTNVGDVDAATAVSDIVTPLKAFNLEAKDAISVVDKLNEVN